MCICAGVRGESCTMKWIRSALLRFIRFDSFIKLHELPVAVGDPPMTRSQRRRTCLKYQVLKYPTGTLTGITSGFPHYPHRDLLNKVSMLNYSLGLKGVAWMIFCVNTFLPVDVQQGFGFSLWKLTPPAWWTWLVTAMEKNFQPPYTPIH